MGKTANFLSYCYTTAYVKVSHVVSHAKSWCNEIVIKAYCLLQGFHGGQFFKCCNCPNFHTTQ